MLGRVGTVITELAPRGVVRLGDGNWTAESDNDTVIPVGGKIIVIGINDLILTVIPFDEMD
jgi:membrane protein implicated in regulation of membrane protease activity